MGREKSSSPPRQPAPHVLRATNRMPIPGRPIQAKLGGATLPAPHVQRALVVQRASELSSSGGGGGVGGGGTGVPGGGGKKLSASAAVFVSKEPTILKSARYFGPDYDRCVAVLRAAFAGQAVVVYVTNGMHWGFENGDQGPGEYEYFGYAVGEDSELRKQHYYTGNFRG